MEEKPIPRWAFALVGAVLLLVLLSVGYALFASGQHGEDETQASAVELRF